MKIGLIARADFTGLGIQSKEFFDHIPCKALVIDSSALPGGESLIPHTEWYPGQKVFRIQPGHGMRGAIPHLVIEDFVKDLDIVVAMETPYDYNVFTICRGLGIKTVLQLNYEFLDFPSGLPYPDLFAAPSMWNFENIPDKKVYLPVPVNKRKLKHDIKEKTFVHIAGRPAVYDRNGTRTFVESLRYVRSEINVVIRCQNPIIGIPDLPNINLTYDRSIKENYEDNYSGGVMVMPRKYGGLCLPINEALGSGMPVIATDISPNNLWLPKEWLVEAAFAGTLHSKKTIDYYAADPAKLAAKIDQFCDDDFYYGAVSKAMDISESISWDNLIPLYMKTFTGLKYGK